MELLDLSKNDFDLPVGIIGIGGKDGPIFKKGNIIQVGCELAGGNEIDLLLNESTGRVNNILCSAKSNCGNRCSNNKSIDGICVIKINK